MPGFEAKTKGLTEYAKTKLKQRWEQFREFLVPNQGSKNCKDIIFDMETKDRLQNGRGNAMLVAKSIYEACKYYELFQASGFTRCAIVSSYRPYIENIKGKVPGMTKLLRRI